MLNVKSGLISANCDPHIQMFSLCFLVQFPIECIICPSVPQAPVNSYSTNGEDKDTDALIDTEPDHQNEADEETPETDR